MAVTRDFKPRAWEVSVEGRVPLFFTNESNAEKYFSVQKKEYPNLQSRLIPLWTGNELLTSAEQQHLKNALALYRNMVHRDTEDNRILRPLNCCHTSISKKLIAIT